MKTKFFFALLLIIVLLYFVIQGEKDDLSIDNFADSLYAGMQSSEEAREVFGFETKKGSLV